MTTATTARTLTVTDVFNRRLARKLADHILFAMHACQGSNPDFLFGVTCDETPGVPGVCKATVVVETRADPPRWETAVYTSGTPLGEVVLGVNAQCERLRDAIGRYQAEEG